MFVRFVHPIGLLASQTSPWCPMETADNLPANVTGQFVWNVSSIIITQHGTTVYLGICLGWSSIIRKQFQSQSVIEVENMQKGNCMQKIR